ncbi:MAG: nucleotidyltransferase domain-containing protein [Thermoproteota archaeon]
MRTLETAWERAKIFGNWEYWVGKISRAAEKIVGENLCGIYLFGSLVRGEASAGSDIDLLIIVKKLSNSLTGRSKIKTRILDEAGVPLIHPFEIHLVSEYEAEAYFRHFKREFVKIR